MLEHPASPTALNCAYEVVVNTVIIIGGETLPLEAGELLWGPQSSVIGHSSAYLYSYTYYQYGWVWTGALYELYCDP